LVDALTLLSRLIRVEGITGAEQNVIDAAAELSRELGLPCRPSSQGLLVFVRGAGNGPRICFCSHLDTVPAGDGWTFPPFGGVIEGDVCYGRGAVDDRGCCLAMLLAAKTLLDKGLPAGELVVALSIGEEGNDPSLPHLLANAGPLDAGVIGEPTMMQIMTAQRGLMIVDLHAEGEQAHAARGTGPNAIEALIADLTRLPALSWPKRDARLGDIRITPTRLNAGVADNVTPPTATARLDIRTTPATTHVQIAERLSRELSSTVTVVADQWIPCAVADNHPLVVAALAALNETSCHASDAASDWFVLQQAGIPAIKLGPGDPSWSHRPDERITRAQLQAGIDGYAALARRFCATKQGEQP